MQRTKLIWGSGSLIVVNPTPKQLNYLTYYKKTLELDPRTFQRKPRSEKLALYTTLTESPVKVIRTFQGFVDQMLTMGECDFEDRRIPMPKPLMSHARGFRFGQEQMFKGLLAKDRSGLLKAPTRYGKSTLIVNTLRVFPGLKSVITAPGVDLLGQLVKALKEQLPGREIKGLFSKSKDKAQSDDITVVSLDSLHKIDAEGTKLLLIDEPHAAVSDSRAPELSRFSSARVYGFGATTDGRYDGADKLITGLIGPVLVQKTFREAVAEGAVCPIKVWAVRLKFDPYNCASRDKAYRDLIFKNLGFNDLVKQLSDFIIPEDFQTIIFADEVKQIELMNTFMTSGVQAAAKKMTTKERADLFGKMVRNEIKRCIATDIFSTGVTFPDVRVIINAASGGSGIMSIQKIGRLGQCRPGKVCGHMIDFLWEPDGLTPEQMESRDFDRDNNQWTNVCRDSRARLKTYEDTGYEIIYVDDINDIKII